MSQSEVEWEDVVKQAGSLGIGLAHMLRRIGTRSDRSAAILSGKQRPKQPTVIKSKRWLDRIVRQRKIFYGSKVS